MMFISSWQRQYRAAVATDNGRRWFGRRLGLSVLLPLVALCSGAAPVHAEDLAIVSGIGNYSFLPNASLPGIDNDVHVMQGVFTRAGFRVLVLFNEQATKARIVSEFHRAQSLVGPADRFVYYQSSHGSQDHRLLTFDTQPDGENTITPAEIRGWMEGIHTSRKTLFLDACFSGGFKSRGTAGEWVKFYSLSGFKERLDRVVRAQDQPAQVNSPSGASYPFAVFASSQANEPSQVVRRQDNGQPQSVFTWRMAGYLAQQAASPWSAIALPTVQDVQRLTEGRQTPVFDSRFLDAPVFTTGGPAAPTPPSRPVLRTFADLYDFANTGPAVSLSGEASAPPNREGRMRPGTRITLNLTVDRPGYLFVINRDDTGSMQLRGWRPKELDFTSEARLVEQSFVDRPDRFKFGQGSLTITTEARDGYERWKAFFFPDREQALVFARAWLSLAAAPNKTVQRNDLGTTLEGERLKQEPTQVLFTSEVHYQVTSRRD